MNPYPVQMKNHLQMCPCQNWLNVVVKKGMKLRDAFKPETDEQVSRDEPSFSDGEHYKSDSTMSVNALNLKTPKIKRRCSAKKYGVLKTMSQIFVALT